MELVEKSIMIFGAGINQIELIREARNLGIKSIVLDPAPDPPGKQLADFFYRVDGQDYETTKAIAIKNSINGIITGQTEKPLRLMAKLAQELNLRFHSPIVVERSLNKWLMKQAFVRHNIPCAKGILITNDTELKRDLLIDFHFPLIIKPKDATSSQGVFKVKKFKDISQFIDITRSFSNTGEIIIEEFLKGSEYSIESITFNGITSIIQFTEKFITPFPRTVEMGHLQPANLTQKEKEEISTVVKCALKAMEIENSASHTEVMMTNEGPKIIEIGARLGGDFIGSYLTKASTGISMDKAAIEIAMGVIPTLLRNEGAFSYIKYLELPVGRIVKEIGLWEEYLEKEDVVYANISLKIGDIVPAITDSAKRPGFVLVIGKNREEVIQKAESYCTQFQSYIKLN